MKLITYNVNGIRSVISKGFFDWLKIENPDILCVQETKSHENQIDKFTFLSLGYKSYIFSAQKKGYSGVAIFTKNEPLNIVYGCDNKEFDDEGRVIRLDFTSYSVLNIYFPSGSSGDVRQAFKYEFLDYIYDYICNLRETIPNLIVCGDYNICHLDIDIHNPAQQHNTSGFLPEERAWLNKFIENDFIDSFRYFNQNPHNYSWWSYRAGAKAKNKGWRIDYNMVSKNMITNLKSSKILSEISFSDHCPVITEFKF